MKGQWLGEYTSINKSIYSDGDVIVNIDELDKNYRGIINIVPKNIMSLPISVGYFETPDKAYEQSITIRANPVDPYSLYETHWTKIKNIYPSGTFFSESIQANFKCKNNTLTITASTKEGIQVETELLQPNYTETSRITGSEMSWTDFKSYVSSLSKNKFLFRGQMKPWKLQTSFHRRNRYCLDSFLNNDVQILHKRLSSLTEHFFDLNKAEQNGAFINLLQHHGYPTPLLDWSHSPYVSAFFAFRDWPIGYSGTEKIRVYIFDSTKWQDVLRQFQILNPPFPHLSVMDFISINNPRLVPQQAITTVSNISDIEHYLLTKGKDYGIDFIKAIDIPANQREEAMSDLRYMGITAGSMFPGIDGACEELKENYFNQ
ncbi:FRG domain-containing protein [Thalassotalea euphylliae]|uniref:FRG domain-containing protein n=1 Tax=Thalassotalea euphylliae TaxID=1655234 RepID=A0A3E0UJL2_9GAMM|nr:FRG domain-containing protein [Thalassotalea euphylliae]REL35952.1 FRG domain-containing protein [Thalassotalea euphylliae]